MNREDLENKLYWFKGKVVEVTDGDTVIIQVDQGYYGSTRQKHRIYQEDGFYFDTPETRMYKGVTEAQKEHGLQAKARAEELLLGKDIYLHCYKRGSFRWLAEIYLEDGKLYTEIMINEGFQKKDEY